MTTKRIFSEKIRLLREISGRTQTEFGEFLDITQADISHWERGRRIPQVEKLVDVCQRLNTTPNYLLGFRGLK